MSVRWYSTTPELIGTDQHKRKAARFELYIGYRTVLEGKRLVKRCKFAVSGTSDAAVEAHAIWMAEQITKLCSGQILAFRKVMGHYRQDKICPVIAPNRRVLTIINHSTSEEGNERVNLRLYVPLADLTTAEATGLVGVRTYGADSAGLGYVRWGDQGQTELEAMYADDFLGKTSQDSLYVKGEELVPDDTGAGVAEGVLDEAP